MANQAVTDIAKFALDQLRSGSPGRIISSDKQQAFAWATGSGAAGLSAAVYSVVASQMSTPATRIEPSGTPPGKVNAGAAKPAGVTIVPKTITLAKYAGKASGNFEAFIDANNLTGAVTSSLIHGALIAWESDLIAAIVGDSAVTKTGTAPSAASILTAQGTLLGRGEPPELVVLSPADYATILTAAGTAGILTNVGNPQEAVQALYGSLIVVSPGLAAGTGIVMARDSVLAVEHSESPAVIVDSYSGSANNVINIVADVIAGCLVARPNGIVLLKV